MGSARTPCRILAATCLLGVCTSTQANTLVDHFDTAITSAHSAFGSGFPLGASVASAVYTEEEFENNFPGYDVPAGEYAYVYQILNDADGYVTLVGVIGIGNDITGVGVVAIDTNVGETPPDSWQHIAGISVVWEFSDDGSEIPPMGTSNGLVITSRRRPVTTGLIVAQYGSTSVVADVIVPPHTPEPSGALLVTMSLFALACLRKR